MEHRPNPRLPGLDELSARCDYCGARGPASRSWTAAILGIPHMPTCQRTGDTGRRFVTDAGRGRVPFWALEPAAAELRPRELEEVEHETPAPPAAAPAPTLMGFQPATGAPLDTIEPRPPVLGDTPWRA